MNRFVKKIGASLLAASLLISGSFCSQPVYADEDPWYYYYENNVALNSEQVTLFPGETFQITHGNLGKVTYGTSDSSVATISESGLVKAVKEGECHVYVESVYGEKACHVRVVKDKGQYIKPTNNKKISVTTKKYSKEYKDFKLTVDQGLYIPENFDKDFTAVMRAIEKVTGMKFSTDINNFGKLEVEIVNAYMVEPCGGADGITLDDESAAFADNTTEVSTIVHELLHCIWARNHGNMGHYLCEGYAESYADDVLKELNYDTYSTEKNRMVNYSIYTDPDTYEWTDYESLTEDEFNYVYNKNIDMHPLGYFLVEYIRNTYGEDTMKKIMVECSKAGWEQTKEEQLNVIKKYTGADFVTGFCSYYNSYVREADFQEVGANKTLDLKFMAYKYLGFELTGGGWLNFKDSLTIDARNAFEFAEKRMGKKFESLNLSVGGFTGTAYFYDINGKLVYSKQMQGYEDLSVPKAVKMKLVGSGNYNTIIWANYDEEIPELKLHSPSTVKATSTSSGVKVEWSKVKNASKYMVYCNDKLVATTTATSWTDKKINGARNTYKVVTVSEDGAQSKASKAVTIAYLKPVKLSSVKLSSGKKNSAKTVTVKWTKNSKAKGYELQYATNSSFKKAKLVTVKSGKTISRNITKLAKKKTYYFRVRGYFKANDNKTYKSAWSAVKKIKIK